MIHPATLRHPSAGTTTPRRVRRGPPRRRRSGRRSAHPPRLARRRAGARPPQRARQHELPQAAPDRELGGRIVAALDVRSGDVVADPFVPTTGHRRAARAARRAGAAMIVALDEIPRASDPCDPSLDWRPVRHHLGIRAFGINAFLGAQAGDQVVERHDEDDGRPRGALRRRARRGALRRSTAPSTRCRPAASSTSRPAPRARRSPREPDTAVLVVGAAPGGRSSVSEWETRQLKASGRS